jgi:hypothetical protein
MRPEMTVTTINVGWFADNYLMALESALHLGMFTMPLGDSDVKKNAPPSNEDIASVVVGALIDPCLSGLRPHPLHIGLPHTSFLRQQLAIRRRSAPTRYANRFTMFATARHSERPPLRKPSSRISRCSAFRNGIRAPKLETVRPGATVSSFLIARFASCSRPR